MADAPQTPETPRSPLSPRRVVAAAARVTARVTERERRLLALILGVWTHHAEKPDSIAFDPAACENLCRRVADPADRRFRGRGLTRDDVIAAMRASGNHAPDALLLLSRLPPRAPPRAAAGG